MAAEDQNGESSTRQDTTREHFLDDLAKGLVSGTLSRRRALRLIGGAIAGAALASFPGVAWAKKKQKKPKKCKGKRVPNCQPPQVLDPVAC